MYDVGTGVTLRALPLPDVPSGGRECELRCDHRDRQLVLEDASAGLALYLFDNQVRVVRLTDGFTWAVAGAHARFARSGLVYADGSRVRLVPFAELPLP